MLNKDKPEKFNPIYEVVSCFIEYNNKILLLQYGQNKSEYNMWGVPAGKVNKNEDKFDAVIREIKEETELEITQNGLNYWGKVYISQKEYDFIYHIFQTKITNSGVTIRVSEPEHKDFKWLFPSKALKMNLVPDGNECIKMFYNL